MSAIEAHNISTGAVADIAPLRCLQLGGGWFPEQSGGMNRYFYELLHHLAEVGVACKGLVAGTPGRWPADDAVNVRAFAPLERPLLSRWLAERRIVAEELAASKYDLAATHFAPYAVPVLNAVARHCPLVVHFQGPWAAESREEGGSRIECAAKAAIERRVYRRASRLMVLSNAFKRVLVENYGIDENRVRVIPGGVECERFEITQSRAEARQVLGWPGDRPIVLTVRRLARRMGLDNLIDAVNIVRQSVPEVLLLIAGSGPLRQDLAQRVIGAGLEKNIRLLGYVPDAQLPLAYRAADLSVVPSTCLEGFGLVAVESLAAGTPVLVTPIGGLPEVVAGLGDGLALPGATVGELAEALTGALLHPNILPDSAACQRHARRFDWSVVAQQLRVQYREAAACAV